MDVTFPDRVNTTVAVTVMGHRLGRALGEAGFGQAGLTVVHSFLMVTELLRDLRLLSKSDTIYPVLTAHLAVAVNFALRSLITPAPAIRDLLGPDTPLLTVMEESKKLLTEAWKPYDGDPGAHPSDTPPLNYTHKSAKKKGGR